jgi:thiol-disulfide isomerase/thioredoxin
MNTSSIKVNRSLLSVLLSLSLASAAIAGMPKEGDAFPDLSRFGLEGSAPDVKGKIVLVDFFASWCEPCKDSFPAMEELKQKYGDKGLVIIAINVDKKKEDMDDFVKKHPVTFTILRDGSNKLVNEVKIPTMPSSFLLDRDGKVHSFHRGFKGAESKKKYAAEIEALLK